MYKIMDLNRYLYIEKKFMNYMNIVRINKYVNIIFKYIDM